MSTLAESGWLQIQELLGMAPLTLAVGLRSRVAEAAVGVAGRSGSKAANQSCPFPQVTSPPKAGHHGTIGSVLDDADDWDELTLLQFKRHLVLAGMRNAFGPGASQDTFNRHLTAHQASPDTHRPEFALPAILLAQALLRALNQELERPDNEDDEV
ncbi:hypothetical protein ACFY1L_55240 [Streptomyces sp. NPDC001663]|uniref:hypothetical protein n=1 Tax=Streptomyces sp. NPDC001663 TaxID=3364597 RepID=UPI0036A932DB